MARVSLQQAADHLRIPAYLPGSPQTADPDLVLKLAQAEAVILDYLKDDAPDHSPLITAAILLQLGELWRFRGDDLENLQIAHTAGDLSPVVTNVLRRLRDPALA
jgi:hypothetical protein